MKNLHLRLDILRAHNKFCEKQVLFMTCVKKIKEMTRKQSFLTPNFLFLTHDTKNIGFR
jgi:hypothetical protein